MKFILPLTFGSMLMAFVVAPVASAQKIVRGPYLQMMSPDAVTIRWRTDVPAKSMVSYGTELANLSHKIESDDNVTEHELRLTGLTPETAYFYSVGTKTEKLAGGDESFRFKTAPLPGSVKPVRVWVLGDSGTGTGGKGIGNAEKVRDGYVKSPLYRDPDVWLMLGDNAYEDGTDAETSRAIFRTYPEILRKAPLWSTFGNHESHTDNGAPYFEAFVFPQNAESGGSPSGSEHYYSFDHANIHFVCLDSQTSKHRMKGGAMLAWLEADLAATKQEWIIAFWHHPPYTKGSHDSDTETAHIEMRANVLPLLESHGVDLVLGGHSHCYERSMLIDGHYGLSKTFDSKKMAKDRGDGTEKGDGAYVKKPGGNQGAVYIVAGNSGKISGGKLNHPVMVISKNVLGSLLIDVEGGRLDVREIGVDGEPFDHFTILKNQPAEIPKLGNP